MNKLQAVKFDKFFVNQAQTMKVVADAVSKLNAAIPAAIKHQAYVLKNLDDNMDESIKESMSKRVEELEGQFMQVVSMVGDIAATRAKGMTADELIAKYNVDLVQYSNDLE
jgi:hypothetical protein